MIYADTSLLVPVYVPEAQSDEANRILEAAAAIWVSDLTVAEFLVALARKVKTGTMSSEQATAVRAHFEWHLEQGVLQRTPVLSSFSEEAGRLAMACPLPVRTLDALHLAAASSLGALVATFDTRLADAGRALGFDVQPSPPTPPASPAGR